MATPPRIRAASAQARGGVLDNLRIASHLRSQSNRHSSADNDEEELSLPQLEARPAGRSLRNSRSSSTQCKEVEIVVESPSPPTQVVSRGRAISTVRPFNYVPVGGKTPSNLPVAVDGSFLTEEWFTNMFIFRGQLPAGGKVVKIDRKRIGEGQGEFGDLYAVTIVEVEGAPERFPRHLICKMAPQRGGVGEKLGLQLIYRNEAHFYNDFSVEGGGLPRPECYHVGADLSSLTPKFVFVLANAFNPTPWVEIETKATLYNRIDGCDNLEHLLRVMRALASFHAKWWGYPGGKKPLGWALHPRKTGKGLLLNAVPVISKSGLKVLPSLFNEQTHPDGTPVAKFGAEYEPILSWAKRLRPLYHYLALEMYRPPLTLLHQDTHLENIFFHDAYEGGCAFIDFGNVGFGHALTDVAFFLATSIETETRRKHEGVLLQCYHEHLLAGGVVNYPIELCKSDYRLQLWRAFVQVLTIIPDFAKQRKKRVHMFQAKPSKADASLAQMYEGFNRRLAAALIDHDWIKALEEEANRACCSMVGCTC